MNAVIHRILSIKVVIASCHRRYIKSGHSPKYIVRHIFPLYTYNGENCNTTGLNIHNAQLILYIHHINNYNHDIEWYIHVILQTSEFYLVLYRKHESSPFSSIHHNASNCRQYDHQNQWSNKTPNSQEPDGGHRSYFWVNNMNNCPRVQVEGEKIHMQ